MKEKPFIEKVREEKFEEEPEEIFEEPIIEKTAPPLPPTPTFQSAPEPEVTTPPLQAEPFLSEPAILKDEPFIETVEEETEDRETRRRT